MKTVIIAAMTEDRVIGDEGEIPWNLPKDQQHFFDKTVGHPVIMGRKTFENIVDKLGGPLEDRFNIVMSESESYDLPNTVTARNKEAALEAAKDDEAEKVFIAGGESIYEEFIEDADEMILSWVLEPHEGNSVFPDFSGQEWQSFTTAVYQGFTVKEYERRRN